MNYPQVDDKKEAPDGSACGGLLGFDVVTCYAARPQEI